MRGSFGIYRNRNILIKEEENTFQNLEECEEVVILSSKQFYEWINILKEEIKDIEGFDLEMINFFMKYG